jgi:pantetheine-phosphate adenylyltransferase
MKAVYAGSFDPITLGHVSVIERAFNLFEEVHILIANNRAKSHYFNLQQRTEMVEVSVPAEFRHRAPIIPFEGIVANYINEMKIDVVIRGIRNATDLDYELRLEQFVRNSTEADTIYLSPYTPYMQTSSSLVRMFFQSKKYTLALNYMTPDGYDKAIHFLQEASQPPLN